ncbi:putative transcriptional regulatory protein [Colletotrichum fructicola Nara gc5]|nr:putative transcriptional regulatory protein [Colletotrichum fructicola Nara gc5]
MPDPRLKNNQTSKTSRSSGACLACRAKKHKCSGERPRCAQCGINNLVCQWPEPRKRGPPKHYINTMEKRLLETENVLCALLSQCSEAQLNSALTELRMPNSGNEKDTRAAEVARRERFGPVYWAKFPLNSAQEIQRWAEDKSSNSVASPRSESIQVAASHIQDLDSDDEYHDETTQALETPLSPFNLRSAAVESSSPTSNLSAATPDRERAGFEAVEPMDGVSGEQIQGIGGMMFENHTLAEPPRGAQESSQTQPSESYESAFLW